MSQDLTVIRTFPNEALASIAQIALEAAGIPSLLRGHDASGMLPSLGFLHGVPLLVRRVDAQRAIRVLDDGGVSAESDARER